MLRRSFSSSTSVAAAAGAGAWTRLCSVNLSATRYCSSSTTTTSPPPTPPSSEPLPAAASSPTTPSTSSPASAPLQTKTMTNNTTTTGTAATAAAAPAGIKGVKSSVLSSTLSAGSATLRTVPATSATTSSSSASSTLSPASLFTAASASAAPEPKLAVKSASVSPSALPSAGGAASKLSKSVGRTASFSSSSSSASFPAFSKSAGGSGGPGNSGTLKSNLKLLADEGIPIRHHHHHVKGRLRARSPSLTPASARAAAANLKVIREAAARARLMRERTLRIRPPQPDSTTGENVKGLWGIYLRSLHTYAVLTVFLTSIVLWAIGDCLSQAIERRLHTENVDDAVTVVEGEQDAEKAPRFKWGRFIGALIDGSLIAGVGGHYWYQWLDKFVTLKLMLRKGTGSFLATKMALEFLVWHPFNLLCFWTIVGFADGDSLSYVLSELSDDFIPTLLGEYLLWTPLDVLNFLFVPVHLQVILCSVGALIESIFLSTVRSQGFPLLGFPEPPHDSLEDRSPPISIVDVIRATDVPFSHALRDGAARWKELDTLEAGFVTAQDILTFLGDFKSLEDFEEEGASAEKLLPGIPSIRATEACAPLLIKHALTKGSITRREYLRFVGELNQCGYRSSLLPEVAFTLFDTTERHTITGTALIQLALLLHDTPEGEMTLKLMMPALEALRNKEVTVDDATSVLNGIDTLQRFMALNQNEEAVVASA